MLTLITYRIKPFILTGETITKKEEYPAEWLRESVNTLMNRHKASLKNNGVKTDLFHNHDEITGNAINRYPLVIYHVINSSFFITGINEGVKSIEEFAKLYNSEEPAKKKNSLVELSENCYLKFEIYKENQPFPVKNTENKYFYRLTDWLPLNNKENKREVFLKIKNSSEKYDFLETILKEQIIRIFRKDFNIDLSNTSLKITNVDDFNRPNIRHLTDKNHIHVFQPFTIKFETNIKLPPLMTFGQERALGNGRLSEIEK